MACNAVKLVSGNLSWPDTFGGTFYFCGTVSHCCPVLQPYLCTISLIAIILFDTTQWTDTCEALGSKRSSAVSLTRRCDSKALSHIGRRNNHA